MTKIRQLDGNSASSRNRGSEPKKDTFKVPFGVDPYIEEVKDRVATFIDKKIWDSSDRASLDTWLSQFVTTEEKYFAAIILDNIIYRSRDQIVSLAEHLLHTIIPNTDLFKSLGLKKNCDWYRSLKNTEYGSRIAFCPVLKTKSPPTKSSFVILREIKHQFNIPDSCFIWPQNLSKISSGTLIIFLDDFLGTGYQFGEFASDFKLSINRDSKYMYCPLIATRKGIDNIKKVYPALPIFQVETASVSESILREGGEKFIDGINSIEVAREFYSAMVKRWGFPNKFILGFENCSNLIAFSHGVPNNSLPILWSETDSFSPLFKR